MAVKNSSKTERPLLHLSAPFIGLLAFLAATLLFVWLFNDILLPFVLGAILAYLIDPLVEKLDKPNGIRRPIAILCILGGFLLIIGGVLAIVTPLLINEASRFINDLPQLLAKVSDLVSNWAVIAQEKLGISTRKEDLEAALSENWKDALKVSGSVGSTLTGFGQSLISFFTIPVFTVIIAYFMLNEWPRMARWTASMIPRPYQDTAKSLGREMNAKLSGFIRGQISVAFILGTSYSIALALAGLNYGLFIGFASGLLAIIPMVGSTLGLIVSVAVAYVQTGELSYVGLIAGIYIVGQLIEGNILTPKIVGDSVGLHPLWVFFALLAGASLMGIVGMLIAVPVAAVASVLLRFTIEQYKQSQYYRGDE